MAIVELWDSQEMHVTAEGTTATRRFSCTWAEAVAGTDGTNWLPKIGWYWAVDRQDLLCTDLDLKANGRTNVIVDALFSTDNHLRRKRKEDFAESWEESLDIFTQEVPVKTYLRYTNPADGGHSAVTEKTWADVWKAAGGDPEKTPELYQAQPRATWSISCFGKSNRIAQILSVVGYVNQEKFITPYFKDKQKSDIKTDNDPTIPTFSDAGKWMFMGARVNRIRKDCWRHDYTFMYDQNGWNTPVEIEGTNSQVTTNMYPTFDTDILFVGMELTDEDGEGAFGAQDNADRGFA